jgi:hypothetical protein
MSAWEHEYEAAMDAEYEWYCTRTQLEAEGWVSVNIAKRPFDQMQDIGRWLEEHCKGEYEHKLSIGHFLFERETDATWFALKWS